MRPMRTLLATARPRFWLYLAGPVLVGLAFGADDLDALGHPLSVAMVLYFLVPANLLLYGLNDIFDAEIDRFNPKKSGRERYFTGERTVVLGVVVSGLLGLGLLVIVPASTIPWLLAFFALAVAYSVPPIRFKARAGLDSLSNGLYITPGVAAFVLLADSLPPVEIIVGAWLWAMAMHAFSAVPDIEFDRRGGITTTATVLGERGTLVGCAICWAGAAGCFALVDLRAGGLLAVYPAIVILALARDLDITRLYWVYPAINTGVGMIFTIAGLWMVVHG